MIVTHYQFSVNQGKYVFVRIKNRLFLRKEKTFLIKDKKDVFSSEWDANIANACGLTF